MQRETALEAHAGPFRTARRDCARRRSRSAPRLRNGVPVSAAGALLTTLPFAGSAEASSSLTAPSASALPLALPSAAAVARPS